MGERNGTVPTKQALRERTKYEANESAITIDSKRSGQGWRNGGLP